MDMEGSPEEFTGSNDHGQIINKGKRTKRQRPLSLFGVAVTSSSSSGGGGGGGGEGGDVYFSSPSPTTSGEISASTEEEEDMANCLILLAQGACQRQVIKEEVKIEKFTTRRFTEIATTTTGKAGFFVYECKTCDRSFPSFQALGGHRASHKRPKITVEEKKSPVAPLEDDEEEEEEERQFNKMSPSLSVQTANKSLHINNKPKVHECSICGSEFSSGQALGGHMRRHRSTPTTTRITLNMEPTTIVQSSHDITEKPRNILPLDLNLPAPEDDHGDSKYQFTPNQQQHLVFSAPALVDCHY